MSVWKSDEKLLIFASVISLLKSFCLRSNITHSTQCFMTRRDTSKSKILHCALYFNSLLGVSPGDETLHLMLDGLLQGQEWAYIVFHFLLCFVPQTATLYPGFVSIVCFILNFFIWGQHSSGAVRLMRNSSHWKCTNGPLA